MSDKKLPNFLIIGAAKAGTTTLWGWLRQHPQIFMSSPKETHFLIYNCKQPRAESIGPNSIRDFERYAELFSDVDDELAVGEASPGYLCDPDVPGEIDKLLPGARTIAILRDPIERAWSSYAKAVVLGEENSESGFLEAIKSEPCSNPDPWDGSQRLIRMGLYAEQLSRYISALGRERVQVHLYEDLKSSPNVLLERCYRFLGVDPEFKADISQQLNVTIKPASKILHTVLTSRSAVRSTLPKLLPTPIFQKLRNVAHAAHDFNIRSKPSLDPEIRRAVLPYFQSDIEKLQDLLQRDLSNWLKV